MKYDKTLMNLAEHTATDSYCKRRQVGCVISRDGRSIVNGYNGTIEGSDNCCEEQVLFCERCNARININTLKKNTSNYDMKDVLRSECSCGYVNDYTSIYINNIELTTKPSVVHAEANAIIFAAKHGISLNGCVIHITTSPCVNCATLIYGAGIKEVVYKKEYKDTSGIDMLLNNGIKVRKYKKE